LERTKQGTHRPGPSAWPIAAAIALWALLSPRKLRWLVYAAVSLAFATCFVSASAQPPRHIDAIFLGDSVTAGSGADAPDNAFASIILQRLQADGVEPRAERVISAFGGIYTDLVNAQEVSAPAGALIVLEVGAHSAIENEHMDAVTYRRAYGTLLDCLQRSGASVVVGTVPWLNWPTADAKYARAERFSAIIGEEAAARGIPVADIWRATRGRPDLVASDQLHPNDAGHRIVADLFWQRIEPLLRHPNGRAGGACPASHDDLVQLVSPAAADAQPRAAVPGVSRLDK